MWVGMKGQYNFQIFTQLRVNTFKGAILTILRRLTRLMRRLDRPKKPSYHHTCCSTSLQENTQGWIPGTLKHLTSELLAAATASSLTCSAKKLNIVIFKNVIILLQRTQEHLEPVPKLQKLPRTFFDHSSTWSSFLGTWKWALLAISAKNAQLWHLR